VVVAGKDGGPQLGAAETLSADLEAAGLSVLLDDRAGVSPGVRFKDAELIGIPTIVVVGRGITDEANPTIEVKDRRSGERVDVALPDAVAHLVAVCAH
jgi:prolyl-tRNA synthetase